MGGSPGEPPFFDRGATIKTLLRTPRTHPYPWIGLGLVLLAVGLRLPQLGWGLPEILEEATPLRQAWEMWGLDAGYLDLNPHFFNYPGLMIYLNLLGQGVLYLVLTLTDGVGSPLEFRTLYLVDPTPFLLTGRWITLLFAAGTVALMCGFGKYLGSGAAGLGAAFLLAINVFHLNQSQLVAVDIPLTFFTTALLLLTMKLREGPNLKQYILAGATMGLATATKYTGALLLLPLVTAHILRTRPEVTRKGQRWFLPAALGVGAVIFLMTSPYSILDFDGLRAGLMTEMEHMGRGHFGQSNGGVEFIPLSLGRTLLGWPLLLTALLGVVIFPLVRRQPWALITLSFTLPYLVILLSWTMQAERYLLPLLPPLILFAVATLNILLPRRDEVPLPRWLVWGGISLLLTLPPLLDLPAALRGGAEDTRIQAKRWFAAHVPTGAYLVVEQHAPVWLNMVHLQLLDPPLREAVLSRTDQPIYAVTTLPLYQVAPERSARYYDPALYLDADLVVTSSGVRSRYLEDPHRFRQQCDLYDTLESSYLQVAKFQSPDGSSPTLTVYRNPRHRIPFGGRTPVTGTPPMDPSADLPLSGEEGVFYLHQGLNYEAFSHFTAARLTYEVGLASRGNPSEVTADLLRGVERCQQLEGSSPSDL